MSVKAQIWCNDNPCFSVLSAAEDVMSSYLVISRKEPYTARFELSNSMRLAVALRYRHKYCVICPQDFAVFELYDLEEVTSSWVDRSLSPLLKIWAEDPERYALVGYSAVVSDKVCAKLLWLNRPNMLISLQEYLCDDTFGDDFV